MPPTAAPLIAALHPRRSVALAIGIVVLGAALLGACGSGDEEPTPTPTPSPPATPTAPAETPAPTPTPTLPPVADDIREVDFTDPAVIGDALDHFGGGQVQPERVAYTDMTGGGTEEAVVVVESGGTMGDLGAAVFTFRDGAPELLQLIEGTGRIEVRFAEVELGLLVVLEPVFAADDPECCPSQLREIVYQWDDQEFSMITDQIIENPDS